MKGLIFEQFSLKLSMNCPISAAIRLLRLFLNDWILKRKHCYFCPSSLKRGNELPYMEKGCFNDQKVKFPRMRTARVNARKKKKSVFMETTCDKDYKTHR